MKSANRDMADSLEMWGIRQIYTLGLGVQAQPRRKSHQRSSKPSIKKPIDWRKKSKAMQGKPAAISRADFGFLSFALLINMALVRSRISAIEKNKADTEINGLGKIELETPKGYVPQRTYPFYFAFRF